MLPTPTIGVFDSGVGGLTVLRALRQQLPSTPFLYLGDTARLPYGSKSRATVARYAVQSVQFLIEQGATCLVIACNTASALALPELVAAAAPLPVVGVVATGADAARAHSRSGDVLVMATTATVASHAYGEALAARGLRSIEKACPLLVPLVEEGWTDHPVTRDVLEIYLDELGEASDATSMDPDTLLLGCTHYPLLRQAVEELVPPGLSVIDSAEITAAAVKALLERAAAARSELGGAAGSAAGTPASNAPAPAVRFFATDGVERFRTLGARFLGEPIQEVTLVDLGG